MRKSPLPWITSSIRKSIDFRNRLLHRYRITACPTDRDAYKKQRNHVTHLLRESTKSYYSSPISNAVSPSCLWKSIKGTLSAATPTWEMSQHNFATLANDFSQHFIAVLSTTPNSSEDNPLSDCPIQTCVSKQLS